MQILKIIPKSSKINENGVREPEGAPGELLGAKMAFKSAKRSLKRGLDGQLGAKMGQLGSKMGSQIHGKSIQNRSKNRLVSLTVF